MKRRILSVAAAGAAIALALAACSANGAAPGAGTTSAPADNKTPAFSAALNQVFNPSDKKGGVIKMANAGDWDTFDPGETYYAYSWDFARLYARSLTTFKAAPGNQGTEIVPDLATGLGEYSNGNKDVTYHLRPGLKFEDGTPIKAADVKYAVLRSIDKVTFPNGPAYFEQFLNLPAGYQGPYKTPNMNTDSAITTPDDTTIVFHMKQAFTGFDYFAQMPQTAPVPQAKDDGAKYRNHVVSSGPYKFQDYQPGVSFKMVRNDQWDPATDPNRKALPDEIDVQLKVDANDLDSRLLSGDIDVDVVGGGVQSAAVGTILNSADKKKNADNPGTLRLWYMSIDSQVKPLDNIECRKAILYATDRVANQNAFGGTVAGGDIATTMLPPAVPGYQKFDLYPAGADNHGDIQKAKDALTACGKPNGFSIGIAYRSERPREKDTATAMQQALARVGITLTPQGYPQGDYFSTYAGNPPFMRAHNIGIALNGWAADWPDGFGFLSQITDSRVIRETGGSSNISVRLPAVDALIDQALNEPDLSKRNVLWGQLDHTVMENALIDPIVYAKSLLVRPKNLTNVFVNNSYGMYDYLALGVA
jgi:peptide/nickel transport system substrate-binding protein